MAQLPSTTSPDSEEASRYKIGLATTIIDGNVNVEELLGLSDQRRLDPRCYNCTIDTEALEEMSLKEVRTISRLLDHRTASHFPPEFCVYTSFGLA